MCRGEEAFSPPPSFSTPVVSLPDLGDPIDADAISERRARTGLANVERFRGAINASAERIGVAPSLLAGFMSRESHGVDIDEEHGTGLGLMQVSHTSFPRTTVDGANQTYDQWKEAWIARGRPAQENIDLGADILAEKIAYFDANFPALPAPDRLRASMAAYNAGSEHVAQYITDQDGVSNVDTATTDGDYTRDVTIRARIEKDEGGFL